MLKKYLHRWLMGLLTPKESARLKPQEGQVNTVGGYGFLKRLHQLWLTSLTSPKVKRVSTAALQNFGSSGNAPVDVVYYSFSITSKRSFGGAVSLADPLIYAAPLIEPSGIPHALEDSLFPTAPAVFACADASALTAQSLKVHGQVGGLSYEDAPSPQVYSGFYPIITPYWLEVGLTSETCRPNMPLKSLCVNTHLPEVQLLGELTFPMPELPVSFLGKRLATLPLQPDAVRLVQPVMLDVDRSTLLQQVEQTLQALPVTLSFSDKNASGLGTSPSWHIEPFTTPGLQQVRFQYQARVKPGHWSLLRTAWRKKSLSVFRLPLYMKQKFREALAEKAQISPSLVQLKQVYPHMQMACYSQLMPGENGILHCVPTDAVLQDALNYGNKSRLGQLWQQSGGAQSTYPPKSPTTYLVMGVRTDTQAAIRALVPVNEVHPTK